MKRKMKKSIGTGDSALDPYAYSDIDQESENSYPSPEYHKALAILDIRNVRGQPQGLVRWANGSTPSWEPKHNITKDLWIAYKTSPSIPASSTPSSPTNGIKTKRNSTISGVQTHSPSANKKKRKRNMWERRELEYVYKSVQRLKLTQPENMIGGVYYTVLRDGLIEGVWTATRTASDLKSTFNRLQRAENQSLSG